MIIKKLTLQTKNFREQHHFYNETMGFETVILNKHTFLVRIGYSTIEFQNSNKATPYHFAINIPANSESPVLEWLKKRTTILKDGKTELIDFNSWQAKAMYFYDADKNIVEFIARKAISNGSFDTIRGDSFIGVSEIGLVTDNIEDVYSKLKKTGLELFDGNLCRFCAAGTDQGLFIIVNPSLKNWFPTEDTAHYSPFNMIAEINGQEFLLNYSKNNLQIS